MPKDRYPSEPGKTGEGQKQPFFQHYSYRPIIRYGTFGFTTDKNEYGHIELRDPEKYPTEVFALNKAGCELIARAFPTFSIEQILNTLNLEFEEPMDKGYSHGMALCKFVGDSIDTIKICSNRGFLDITYSSEYLQETQKGYASDVGKNVIDKLFEDLIPYLLRKSDENEHLISPSSPKGKLKNNDL